MDAKSFTIKREGNMFKMLLEFKEVNNYFKKEENVYCY